MKTFDVAIIGGGPAGGFLGHLLAREKVTVAIFDDQQKKKRKICGEYLCPKGVEILWEAGLKSLTGERFIKGMKLVSPDGTSVWSKFPHNISQGGRAIRRDQFDEEILSQAQKSGCQLFRGERVEFQYDGMLWKISYRGEVIFARQLVGADGRQSIVAKKMGVEKKNSSHRIAIHQFVPQENTSQYGEMHILKSGSYVGINPTGEKEFNLSVVCDAEKLKGKDIQQVWIETLSESPELLSRFANHFYEELFVTSPISHQVTKVTGTGWSLIGDAAGFLDPLTGEGMYQALLSAKLLANAYLEERSLTLFPQHFSEYEKRRKEVFFQKKVINVIFQKLIRMPILCNWIARFLNLDEKIANTFIGMVGNIFTPTQALRHLVLERK